MKKAFSYLAIITSSICIKSYAQIQDIRASLPDTISLSDTEIKSIYYKVGEDTNGFMPLTEKTSLKQYKGKENKLIMQAMKKIKGEMDDNTIIQNIAWKSLPSLHNYPNREEETIIIKRPIYKLIKNGVLLIGVRLHFAPWNDIVSQYDELECYFVSFDKSVKHIKNITVYNGRNTHLGIIEFDSKTIEYEHFSIESGDSITFEIPHFEGGYNKLTEFIKNHTKYPFSAAESKISGTPRIEFTITPEGEIANCKIIETIDPTLAYEFRRVIRSMKGKWTCGKLDGKPIETKVRMSLTFRLEEIKNPYYFRRQ